MKSRSIIVMLAIAIGLLLGRVIGEAACGDQGSYRPEFPDDLDYCHYNRILDREGRLKTSFWLVTFGDGQKEHVTVSEWGDCYPPAFIFSAPGVCWPVFETPFFTYETLSGNYVTTTFNQK